MDRNRQDFFFDTTKFSEYIFTSLVMEVYFLHKITAQLPLVKCCSMKIQIYSGKMQK